MSNTARWILSYIITSAIFLCLDFSWLTVTSSRLYQPILAAHLAAKPDLAAAGLFYMLYFAGVTFFVTQPQKIRRELKAEPRMIVGLRGFFYGVIAYATYDLTNQATLSGWPWRLSIIDMAWGGFATACAAALTHWLCDKIIRRQQG